MAKPCGEHRTLSRCHHVPYQCPAYALVGRSL